jgi:LDH2 family malate/lactate/ureidoglycolate dehydrogenase
MEWEPNEILFYGGLAGVALSLILAVIAGIVLGLSWTRLNAQLDEEYGKKRKVRS